MKIILDTANTEEIKKIIDKYPVKGITTNPSILSKAKKELKELFIELKEIVKDKYEIHVQTTEKEANLILKEALELKEYFKEKFFIKIPVTEEGMKAVRLCKENNINVTVTAIFTPVQALIAAEAGADYVAPYVNRIDNITGNGTEVVDEIVKIFKNYNYKTEVLAASFKNTQQILECALSGCQAITIGTDILENALSHPYTTKSLEDFDKDWNNSFGDKKVVEFL